MICQVKVYLPKNLRMRVTGTFESTCDAAQQCKARWPQAVTVTAKRVVHKLQATGGAV